MNIFKRLFRIGKAESHSSLDKLDDPIKSIDSKELNGMFQEAEVELDNYRERLAGMKKGSEEATALSKEITKYETELKTLKARAKVSKATRNIKK